MWPVGQAVKTAASHAANVGSIPARVTTYFRLKKKVSKEDFSQSSLQSEKQLNRELTVEKNGKEKKVLKVSFAYFSFQRKVSWC